MSYIIMKYDDLSVESFKDFTRVADFSLNTGRPVSMGIIGRSLAEGGALYKNRLIKWREDGIEIWNHGYFHTSEEFSSASYEQQCQSILNTQKLMKSELGQPAATFGSPHNNSTETTIRALKDVAPEIRNFLFAVDGTSVSNARQLLVRCDMEVTTGKIDLDFLKKNYSALKAFPYMVIQGHPSFWTEEDFERNEKVMAYLEDEGNSFVTPCGLPEYLSENDSLAENNAAGALLEFAAAHEKIALYGAGEIGREWYRFLRSKSVSLDAFIVSDGQKIQEEEICTLPVMPFSKFGVQGGGEGVIVAMMPKFHGEIEKILQNRKVDYFCPGDKEDYMQLVHYVRGEISG